jgi:hypothetical protein
METTRQAAERDVACVPDFSGRTGISWDGGAKTLRKMPLEFLLVIMDDTFYHVTREFVENPAFRLETFNRGDGMQMLTVDVAHVLKNRLSEITLRVLGVERFMEFLCVPKFNALDAPLRLVDENGILQVVEDPAPVTLPDGTPARRFLSTGKLKLRRDSGIAMQLWEARPNAEPLLLLPTVDTPYPGDPSPFTPDTISRIVYY